MSPPSLFLWMGQATRSRPFFTRIVGDRLQALRPFGGAGAIHICARSRTDIASSRERNGRTGFHRNSSHRHSREILEATSATILETSGSRLATLPAELNGSVLRDGVQRESEDGSSR